MVAEVLYEILAERLLRLSKYLPSYTNLHRKKYDIFILLDFQNNIQTMQNAHGK